MARFVELPRGLSPPGAPRSERPETAIYRFATRIFYKLLKLLAKTDYDPAHGNFSIISRRVVEQYRTIGETLRFYGAILDWLGFQLTAIQAEHGTRNAGSPGYNLRKRLLLAFHIILAHSDRPLCISPSRSGSSFHCGRVGPVLGW
jgi:dolichol-phosphate mannosyltransferase